MLAMPTTPCMGVVLDQGYDVQLHFPCSRSHSRCWQACHDRPGQGTLYQSRYRSARIDSDAQLLTVLRYIERNPVRAGWSRARSTGPGRPAPGLSGRAGTLASVVVR